MQTIHKFPFNVADQFFLAMPLGAQLLRVDVQNDAPTIWALVNTEKPMVAREFACRGTGHAADGLKASEYVGTFFVRSLVFHLFDQGVGGDR